MERDAEAIRLNRVRQLFEARYNKKMTQDDVIAFHGWVYERYPHLVRKSTNDADPYHQLKVDLHGLYTDVYEQAALRMRLKAVRLIWRSITAGKGKQR